MSGIFFFQYYDVILCADRKYAKNMQFLSINWLIDKLNWSKLKLSQELYHDVLLLVKIETDVQEFSFFNYYDVILCADRKYAKNMQFLSIQNG